MREKITRKSIRLKDFDYSQSGYYFVTICVLNRIEALGEIVGADVPVRPDFFVVPLVKLTPIGEIVSNTILALNDECIGIDEFVIMPNHIHLILQIKYEETDEKIANGKNNNAGIKKEAGGQGRPPLQKIVQRLKSYTTKEAQKFGIRKLWQRGYYDHIVRGEEELQKIRQYIIGNPANYAEDKYFLG